MKKFALFGLTAGLSCAVCAGAFTNRLESACAGTVLVTCAQTQGWTITAGTEENHPEGVEELHVRLTSPVAAPPPRFEVSFSVPQREMHFVWHTGAESLRLPPKWHQGFVSSLASGMPLVSLVGIDDMNKFSFAASEAVLPVRCRAGLKEEDCTIPCSLVFFERPAAPVSDYSVRIRFDRRSRRWDATVRDLTAWMEKAGGYVPIPVPEAARDALYSTWYAFTQDVSAAKIEDEAARAAALGMKTLILDDGWQTDEKGRAYERCGDMTVSTNKFPEGMAAHVRKVRACGIRYMVWCAVPFVGYKNAVFGRFKGKFLRDQPSVHCSVLDPRFPEVREYLASMFERMLLEWGVDGFKFDYIGQLALLPDEKDPAVKDDYAGRDTKSVPDAVDLLMTEILRRLRAVKPDVLLEYRQPYLGPAIRRYGNMIRAIDCPGEMQKNIVRTAMLRLTSGDTAVHSDMLEWNRTASAEDAAQSILASLFSTIQYSMVLSELSDDHLRMLRHWIGFVEKHRRTLLRGRFTARNPQSHYPVLEAESDSGRVIAVYTAGTVVRIEDSKPTVVVNATGKPYIYLELPEASTIVLRDTFGARRGVLSLPAGVSKLDVPVSGYAETAVGMAAAKRL